VTPEQEILEDALIAVRQRIDTFSGELKAHAEIFPLAMDVTIEMTARVRVEMDAFSKRYEMTQDQIVRKLFRSVLAVERGVVLRTKALGDVIDAMAQLGVVHNAAEWHEITKLRNMLAHDYMVTRTDAVALLNQAWRFAPKLVEMVARVEAFVASRNLLAETTDP
jgi:uncharacterized protein with HEPN domain